MNSPDVSISAGPLRRLGAMLYDLLLVTAVLMVATLPFIFFARNVLVPSEVGALAYLYWIWEICIAGLYFGFFWTKNSRTLGMQAWRLRIERFDGGQVTGKDSLTRFFSAWLPWLPGFLLMTLAEHSAARATLMPIGVALLGAGFLNYLAAYWTPHRRALHEWHLATRVVKSERL